MHEKVSTHESFGGFSSSPQVFFKGGGGYPFEPSGFSGSKAYGFWGDGIKLWLYCHLPVTLNPK